MNAGAISDVAFAGVLAVVAVCITVGFCAWLKAGQPTLRWPWKDPASPRQEDA